MTYRDEVEALRAQLAEKQAEIDALRKQVGVAAGPSGQGLTVSRWLGPSRLDLEAVVPHEMDVEDYDDVLAVIRETLSMSGAPTILGRALHFSVPGDVYNLQISVSPKNGQTTIKTSERYGTMAKLGCFNGGGLFVLPVIMSIYRISWDELLVVGSVWVALLGLGLRMVIKRIAARRAARTRQLHGLVESAVRTAIAARATKSQVRVAEDLVEHDHDDEAAQHEAPLPHTQAPRG